MNYLRQISKRSKASKDGRDSKCAYPLAWEVMS